MMGDNGPSALADDVRVRHLLRVANVSDIINDVVGIFLKRVVSRAVKGRPAAVVIDAQSSTDVDILNCEAHFEELGVEARGLLDRLFDRQDVGDLRTNMEMEQLQAMREGFGF